MEIQERMYSRNDLSVGMKFRAALANGSELYCNDNYQFGLWIEEKFNSWTRSGGKVASGKLDTTEPIVVTNLLEDDSPFIGVRARCIGGVFPNRKTTEFAIKLDTLSKYFERM